MKVKHCLMAAALFVGFAVSAEENALIGHWPLNEGEGVEIKDACGKNDGKLCRPENSQWVEGRDGGKALKFSGEKGKGAYVVTGKLPEGTFTKGFTLMMWFKPDGKLFKRNSIWTLACSGRKATGFMMGIHYQRLLLGGNGNQYSCHAASVYGKNPFKGDEWVHFAASHDGDKTFKVYIDGALAGVSSEKNSGPVVPGGNQLCLGSQFGWGAAQGAMSNVKLFNRALTDAEVLKEMQGE